MVRLILILLISTVVVGLFSIFIIFASNRDIEGETIKEKNYICENIRYPFALLLALIILAESAVYFFFSRLGGILMIGTIVVMIVGIFLLYKNTPKTCKEREYLFSWDNIPGNDKGKLIEFLTQKFGIDWVKIAKIEKIDDGGTIKLTDENNFLSLKLNNEKTKVNLEINDCRTYEFIVKIENNKLNIYERDTNADNQKERVFFEGLYMLLIYSIFVVVFTTIMVLIIESIYNSTEMYILYLYILLSLILLFTATFTFLMAGYVGPLVLGCISGIILFLVIVSWRFGVLDISLGVFKIPIYVPASSFFGAICSIFVNLYYNPSRLFALKDDDMKLREYIARIFASIILGLFVYAVALPNDNGPKLPISVFVLFGFASGFYISPMLSFLRKKIFSLIDEAGMKEDDRKRIIKEIGDHPEQYSILSDDEIKHIANQTGIDEKKLTKLIIEKDIEKNLDKYSILSDDEIKHIANQTGMDKERLTKLIIEKDIEENPDKYSILSDDEIKHIANQTGMDKERLNKKIKCEKQRLSAYPKSRRTMT